MSFGKEFKEFAMRGNVVDMAVGIIIGAAFGKIVSAFVNGVIMPPLGLLIGGVDFTDLKHVIKPAEGEVAEVAILYGEFLQTVIDFTIVAFAIFMAIKVMNSLKAKEEKKPAKPSKQEVLLEEIRDALVKKPVAKTAAKPAAKPTAKKAAPAKKAPTKKTTTTKKK
jgi:large conductance mechanosensitive channel